MRERWIAEAAGLHASVATQQMNPVKLKRAAAALLPKGFGYSEEVEYSVLSNVLAANRRFLEVGDAGIEPATSAV